MDNETQIIDIMVQLLTQQQKQAVQRALVSRTKHFEELTDLATETDAKVNYHAWWNFHYDTLTLWNDILAKNLRTKTREQLKAGKLKAPVGVG